MEGRHHQQQQEQQEQRTVVFSAATTADGDGAAAATKQKRRATSSTATTLPRPTGIRRGSYPGMRWARCCVNDHGEREGANIVPPPPSLVPHTRKRRRRVAVVVDIGFSEGAQTLLGPSSFPAHCCPSPEGVVVVDMPLVPDDRRSSSIPPPAVNEFPGPQSQRHATPCSSAAGAGTIEVLQWSMPTAQVALTLGEACAPARPLPAATVAMRRSTLLRAVRARLPAAADRARFPAALPRRTIDLFLPSSACRRAERPPCHLDTMNDDAFDASSPTTTSPPKKDDEAARVVNHKTESVSVWWNTCYPTGNPLYPRAVEQQSTPYGEASIVDEKSAASDDGDDAVVCLLPEPQHQSQHDERRTRSDTSSSMTWRRRLHEESLVGLRMVYLSTGHRRPVFD